MTGYAGSPARILIVDDMGTNRALAKYALPSPQYKTTEAASGAEALDILGTESYDLVLLDVMMPGIDGIETCRHIREDMGLTLLPIILLTTLGGPENIARGMEAGATDYVVKPFSSIELRARVDACVGHKRLTDRLETQSPSCSRSRAWSRPETRTPGITAID